MFTSSRLHTDRHNVPNARRSSHCTQQLEVGYTTVSSYLNKGLPKDNGKVIVKIQRIREIVARSGNCLLNISPECKRCGCQEWANPRNRCERHLFFFTGFQSKIKSDFYHLVIFVYVSLALVLRHVFWHITFGLSSEITVWQQQWRYSVWDIDILYGNRLAYVKMECDVR